MSRANWHIHSYAGRVIEDQVATTGWGASAVHGRYIYLAPRSLDHFAKYNVDTQAITVLPGKVNGTLPNTDSFMGNGITVGDKIYFLTNGRGQTIYIIDTTNDTFTRQAIPVMTAHSILVGTRIYYAGSFGAGRNCGYYDIITGTNKILFTRPAGNTQICLGVLEHKGKIYFAPGSANDVWDVFDAATDARLPNVTVSGTATTQCPYPHPNGKYYGFWAYPGYTPGFVEIDMDAKTTRHFDCDAGAQAVTMTMSKNKNMFTSPYYTGDGKAWMLDTITFKTSVVANQPPVNSSVIEGPDDAIYLIPGDSAQMIILRGL